MGHLGALLLLTVASIARHRISGAAGHSLPACSKQLEFRCNNGSCIPGQAVCDGRADCEDGSDEHNCGHLPCEAGEFACRSGRCVPTRSLCNGLDDCGDGSDEVSCRNCTADAFPCGDACMPRRKLCDGHRDCEDGRDEARELCGSAQPRPQTSPTCPASQFRCGDGQCVRHSWRCDNSPDCSDGSDEDNCVDQNECLVNNGGCSHHCKDLESGFMCDCPENMRLVGDNQCEEVDMCLKKDVCDQLCVHGNGSLTCECHRGYQMNATTGQCQAEGDEARLLITTSKEIQEIRLSGTTCKEVAARFPGPGPVAALTSDRTLYSAQHGRGSIYSPHPTSPLAGMGDIKIRTFSQMNDNESPPQGDAQDASSSNPAFTVSLNGTPQDAVLVLRAPGSVSSLAVDWIHRLLYWTSMESQSVHISLLDGSAQRQLITGLDKPSAVAVEPLQGLLFWAVCGSSPRIERASLDGRDRMVLVTSSIRHPAALSLDMPRRLLYWADKGMRSISRINLEGRDRKTVVESNGYLDRPFGLAVFEGFVYWSDEVTRSICRASKHNGSRPQVLLRNVTPPGGFAIIQPVLQPDGPAACGRSGLLCTDKCVVDLSSESPGFTCTPPETRTNGSQETPAIPYIVPVSDLSDPAFAGILSLIVFLSVLLVVMTLWWWRREEFTPSRTLTAQSFSLKESQDPLIQGPNPCPGKETLLKPDLDGE